MAYNDINIVDSPNIIVITDNEQNQVIVTAPQTRVVQVNTPGPQGKQGNPGQDVDPSTLVTTSSFNAFTGSYNVEIATINSDIVSISTSYLPTSSFDAFTSNYTVFANNYALDSSSFESNIFNLSSSLSSLTGSLNGTASYAEYATSASVSIRSLTASLAPSYTLTSSFHAFTSSFTVASASVSSRLTTNESNITTVSSSLLSLSASYVSNSSSFNTRINSITSSLNAFTSSYNTGSFTGSFTGSVLATSLTASNALINGNIQILGTASIAYLNVVIESSSVIYSSGSNQLGDAANDTQTLYGSVIIPTGSLVVSGSSFFTGSLNLGTGTVIYGDTTNPSLVLDQTTGAYLKYGTTSEVTVQGSTAILKASNTVQLRTGTTTHLFVSSSGFVGIGTIVPTSKLQIAVGSVLIDNNFSYRQKTSIGGNIGLIYIDNSDLMGIYEGKINVTSTGNVGIGTATPAASLHISGSSGSILFEIDSNSQQNILYVSGSGNVGIGTSTPTATLDVAGIINAGSGLRVNGTTVISSGWNHAVANGTTSLPGLYFLGSSTTGLYRPTTDVFGIVTSGSERMRIDANGNVGIGTTAPGLLGVTKELTIEAKSPTNQVSLNLSGYGTSDGALPAFLQFYNNGNRVAYIANQRSGGADNTSNIVFANANAGVLSQNMTITSTGNVGIGTTSPTARLHISGAAATPLLRVSNPASVDFTIQSDSTITDYTGLYWGTDYKFLSKQAATLFVNIANNVNFANGFATKTIMNSNGQLGIGVSSVGSIVATAHVKGSGTTSATTALRVENLNTSASLVVLDNGNVGINTASPLEALDITGNFNLTGFIYRTGVAGKRSFLYTSGNNEILNLYDNSGVAKVELRTNGSSYFSGGNVGIGTITPATSLHVVGNTILSGSAGTGSALTVYKSGSTVMSIQGSQGELFSITDSLSGSLFSVSNISGLPILEVFSDNTVLLGSYLDPMLMTTQRVTANSGSTTIYSLPTASYDGVFVDYTIRSGSNARAGQFMGMWSGSATSYTDNSITDFGTTSGFNFGLVVSGANMVLTGSASTNSWTVRAAIRSI